MVNEVMTDSTLVSRESDVMPPKWQIIADDLRDQIRDGRLQVGDRLPSYAKLREAYGASHGTVLAALRQLRAEGLIVGEQGVAVSVVKKPD